MAMLRSLLAVMLLSFSVASGRPADSPALDQLDLDTPLTGAASSNVDPLQNPRLYLILAEAEGDDEADEADGQEAMPTGHLEKRSAEEDDDLEAAAGTNVLRPLFVYRQQLALYRERVKKGAIKRFGFRPRF